MSNIAESRRDIIETVKHHSYDALESKWLEYIESKDFDAEFLSQLTHYMLASNKGAQVVDMLEILLAEYANAANHEAVIGTCRVLQSKSKLSNQHQQVLVTALHQHYKSLPNIDRILMYSQIETADDLSTAFHRFNEFLFYNTGEIFKHQAWGVGVIKTIDFVQQQLSLDFGKDGVRNLTISGAKGYLEKLPAGHFMAIKKTNLPHLKTLASKEPVNYVKLIITSYNGKIAVPDLKRLSIDGVMTDAEWSAWWTKNKAVIKQDAYIDYSDENKGEYTLRTQPKVNETRYSHQFTQVRTLEEKLLIISDYAEVQKTLSEIDDTSRLMADNLVEYFASIPVEGYMVEQLKCYFCYEYLTRQLKGKFPPFPQSLQDILGQAENLGEALFSFSNPDYQKKIFEAWMAKFPDQWPDDLLEIIDRLPVKLLDNCFKKIPAAKRDIVIRRSLHYKHHNPELYLFGLQTILKGQKEHPGMSMMELLQDIFVLMEEITIKPNSFTVDKKVRSTVLSKARKFIEQDDFRIVRETMIGVPVDDARYLLSSINSNRALSEMQKTSLEYAMSKSRPDIEEKRTKSVETVNTQMVHYCTSKAFDDKTQEYQHIVSDEIPQNSKDIEIARQHGDLRENAEYQSAKQKQKVLLKQADELLDLMKRARVMELTNVSTERVSFGTKVRVLNLEKDKEETFTIFGIWEADPEHNCISYLSPLGAAFLSKVVGDTFEVTLPDGKVSYKVLHIEKAL